MGEARLEMGEGGVDAVTALAAMVSNAAQSRYDDRRCGNLEMTPEAPLFRDPQALAALCQRHHICRLSLFGSRLKGSARPDSDVDLLVAFEPGLAPGLIGLAVIQAELSDLLDGRAVDLRTEADLSQYFRAEIVSTAAEQYAA